MDGLIPLSIMAFMHFWTAIAFAYKKNWPMAIVFGSYCIATLGFVWGLSYKA